MGHFWGRLCLKLVAISLKWRRLIIIACDRVDLLDLDVDGRIGCLLGLLSFQKSALGSQGMLSICSSILASRCINCVHACLVLTSCFLISNCPKALPLIDLVAHNADDDKDDKNDDNDDDWHDYRRAFFIRLCVWGHISGWWTRRW